MPTDTSSSNNVAPGFVLVCILLMVVLCVGTPDLLDALIEWVQVHSTCP